MAILDRFAWCQAALLVFMAATRTAVKYYLKTKGQGNMNRFHIRPQQSTVLLQKTCPASSLAKGAGSYWSRRKTMHE